MARPHLGWSHPWYDDDLPTKGDLAEDAEHDRQHPLPVPARIRALVGDDPRTPEAQPPDLATFVAGLQ